MNPWIYSIGGGAIIGFSALLLWLVLGKVAGISGIFYRSILHRRVRSWESAFIFGLISSGIIWALLYSDAMFTKVNISWLEVIFGGVLVGIGTRLGNGCTSGHGICGNSRLSPRSITSTMIFIASGMVVATLVKGVLS